MNGSHRFPKNISSIVESVDSISRDGLYNTLQKSEWFKPAELLFYVGSLILIRGPPCLVSTFCSDWIIL